ncbi:MULTISPECIES: hypothetical protein [unclassified Thioalkalivibrio]|uniref:hypothetical protein n=1 Tax=unclassified Thioalkalivibrio TaxID=2621013 RepID=UPI0003642C52|nr:MULTISPECIES: hypothetical protein [unclassified Thioalkalivibrio]
MEVFYSRLSEKISDLILAVIALGLLVVSVEYVQFLTDHPGTFVDPEFWKRIILALLVTVFTAYKFVAYSAYFCAPDNATRLARLSPVRVILMFLCDLAQVMLVAWLYAVLLIGHLTSLGGREGATEVTLGDNMIQFLFLFMALWHVAVLLWYTVARGTWRDRAVHGGFAVAYLLAIGMLSLVDGVLSRQWTDWIAIAFYGACVVLLYRLKAIPDIRNALPRSAQKN